MAGEKIDMASAQPSQEGSAKRERSTIEFPYGDLNDAIEIVTTIYSEAGTECQTDQLAGFLKQSVTSGAFRLKLQVARMAGFVEVERGSVRLTKLGQDAADESQRKRALADGFLGIELYSKIFDKYRGRQLPPAAALEREMANFGVAKKQTSKARQAFERSAEQSGFYNDSRDRLIQPITRDRHSDSEASQPVDRPNNGGNGSGGGDGFDHLDPLLRGLILRLPEAGSVWPEADRNRWLAAARMNFELVYETDPDTPVEAAQE